MAFPQPPCVSKQAGGDSNTGVIVLGARMGQARPRLWLNGRGEGKSRVELGLTVVEAPFDPSVLLQHLKTVLSILSPSPEFPAPRRKANLDYYEPAVQGGLQKLMLLSARVEGKVFDLEGARRVGKIEGSIDGLRAQLVAALQGVGASLASALEGASKSLYFTVEGRRMDMEDKEKGEKKG